MSLRNLENLKSDFPWSESITAAKSTESFVGCKINGTMAKVGYDVEDFKHAKEWAKEHNVQVDEYHLRDVCGVVGIPSLGKIARKFNK